MLLLRAAVVVLVLTLAAGCADRGDESRDDPAPTPLAGAPTAPPCAYGLGGRVVTVTTSRGEEADVLVLGTAAKGVVLGPQDDGDVCQWIDYASKLAGQYRVALYDWAEPRAEMPALAAAALREAGADDLVLGGASYGAATALAQAHTVEPPLAGVLSLGGELTLPGEDFRPGLRQWTGPLLQISSVDDDLFSARDVPALRRIHPGPEEVLMLPGSEHGVELLAGEHAARVEAAIETYLDRVLR